MSDSSTITTTTHDFKTHFSEYVRLIENDPDAAIIVQRYNKAIGIFIPVQNKEKGEK